MALPQQFLDELRARLTLSTVIGRQVKLIRAGREFKACCPFHKEKTPSFTVNDEKGFYHCFGCGAHGDVITFVMENGNLGFVEAVEQLASEAGLEVPKASPREVAEAKRRASVLEVVEAACAFYEQQLRMPAGQDGLDYFRRRGLDDAVIGRFRLGYAPGGGALKAALARQDIDEDQLVEAGLLKRRDDGSVVEYFRNRVMFPITDRRGRVIAFGGRTLGDGQPKYLNSPDTPAFHKGLVLYNLAQARAAAGKAGDVIVAEGYMDVIALTRAGLPQAVAPLGTALTETQIEELWKLADEPILCFDGDAAGQRAAARAAERALAVLRPGKSLRFALLPSGRDPDDILRDDGPAAVRRVLESAQPLMDVIWTGTVEGRDLATPERRAALERDLDDRVGRIADRTVQGYYRRAFRDRLFELFRARRPARGGVPGRGPAGGHRGKWSAPLPPQPPLPPVSAEGAEALRRRILLATLISHPELLDDVAERLGGLDFPEPELDKLREHTLMVLHTEPSLDFAGLRDHLRADGVGNELDALLNSNVFVHAAFSRPEAETETARRGWEHTYELTRRKELIADIDRSVERLGADWPDDSAFESFVVLKSQERLDRDD